ncbi:MAG: hypothetical protein QF909_17095 [SAR202 cluster bacterium]|nr:hypothetical protein [SAR202 cluster bacterium]
MGRDSDQRRPQQLVHANQVRDRGTRRFSFERGWDGTISEVDPQRAIQFNVEGEGGWYLRFEIEAADGGCTFTLTDRMGDGVDVNEIFDPETPKRHMYQPGGPGTHWNGVTAGYPDFVDALERHLTGSKLGTDYDELCEAYRPILDDRVVR